MANDLNNDVTKDVRLIERSLAKGFMSRASSDKLMKDLPDVAEKGEFIDIEGEPGGEDDAGGED
ncbi:MAG: hypothetical protein U1F43_22365 [Myxococcota bacterium]